PAGLHSVDPFVLDHRVGSAYRHRAVGEAACHQPLARRCGAVGRVAGGGELGRGLRVDVESPHREVGTDRSGGRTGDSDLVARLAQVADSDSADHCGNDQRDSEHNRRAEPGLIVHRILFPNALDTSPTASSAVWLNSSSTGLTSTRSIETILPVSAMVSMARCASRKVAPPRTGVPTPGASRGSTKSRSSDT